MKPLFFFITLACTAAQVPGMLNGSTLSWVAFVFCAGCTIYQAISLAVNP